MNDIIFTTFDEKEYRCKDTYLNIGSKRMNFSEALELIKQGKKLSRENWNGKDMFVYLVKGSKFTVNRAPLNEIYPEGSEITYRPHIDLKAADGTCGVWSISNNDALAEDWIVV